jgi:predicted porin
MAAFADATLVGTVDAGLMSNKAPSNGSAQNTTSFQSGGMTTSYFGFEGSEDLGNGTSAVYELTTFISAADGSIASAELFSRSAFVGLKNNQLGQVTLGRQANPSFLPTVLFNAYADSANFGPLWHQTYFNLNPGYKAAGNVTSPTTAIYDDTAWDNAVSYTTPDFAGLTVSVVGSKTNGTSANTGSGTNSGANALYFHGDLALTAYYMRTTVGSASTSNYQQNQAVSSGSNTLSAYASTNGQPSNIYGVGGSYDLHSVKLFATYQDAKFDAMSEEGKTSQVSALIPAGKGNFMAEYATTKFTLSGASTTYSEWAAGYDYNISKKTDAYVTLGQAHVSTLSSNGQTLGAGIRVKF